MDFLERQAWLRPVQCVTLLLLPAIYVPSAPLWWAVVLSLVAVGFAFGWPWRPSARTAVIVSAAALLSVAWAGRTLPGPADQWPFALTGTITGTGTVIAEAPVSRRGNSPFRLRIESVSQGDW